MSISETGTNLIEPIRGPKGYLTWPDIKYLKSPEGVAEFKKAGFEYPDSAEDKAYAETDDKLIAKTVTKILAERRKAGKPV